MKNCLTNVKITRSTLSLNDEFKQVTKIEKNRIVREPMQWYPPAEGILKINTDAAFFKATKKAFLGAVSKDALGKVFFCARSKKGGVQSPL